MIYFFWVVKLFFFHNLGSEMRERREWKTLQSRFCLPAVAHRFNGSFYTAPKWKENSCFAAEEVKNRRKKFHFEGLNFVQLFRLHTSFARAIETAACLGTFLEFVELSNYSSTNIEKYTSLNVLYFLFFIWLKLLPKSFSFACVGNGEKKTEVNSLERASEMMNWWGGWRWDWEWLRIAVESRWRVDGIWWIFDWSLKFLHRIWIMLRGFIRTFH
jgi:hypothetical protein